jgi:hypothetical protein
MRQKAIEFREECKGVEFPSSGKWKFIARPNEMD